MGPALRVDHSGFVVSDLDAAAAFFVDVLGFSFVRDGAISDAEGDSMTRWLGVPPRASLRYLFLSAGDTQIELLHWSGVEQGRSARNSDLAGRHLAVTISDYDATLQRISEMDGVAMRESSPRGFVYVSLPFGLELQLYPA